MKNLILLTATIALGLASPCGAAVIDCPERYPSKESNLAVEPPSTGTVRLKSARLSGAYMVSGDLYAEQRFVPSISTVKGGMDIGYSFPGEGRWLVCEYGGGEKLAANIELWEKLDPNTVECMLKLRKTKVVGGESRWTATASCK